jgi:hypothetical protein
VFRTSILRENARVAAATYENLYGFYEKLKSTIEEYGLTAERMLYITWMNRLLI